MSITNPLATTPNGATGSILGASQFGVSTLAARSALSIVDGVIHAHNDVKIEGNLIVGDTDIKHAVVSIRHRLDAIEERLAIVHFNSELESRWDRLREIRKQYLETEAYLLELEQVADILRNH